MDGLLGEEEEGHQRAITPRGAFQDLSQLLHTSEASLSPPHPLQEPSSAALAPALPGSPPSPSKEDFPSMVLSDDWGEGGRTH